MTHKKRSINDIIILTIFPHLFTLFYTRFDFVYSTIIILSSGSSFIWHYNCEPHNHYLLLDYFFAGLISYYEVYKVPEKYQLLTFSYNASILLFNKAVYILSKYKIINYPRWHSVYHILSSIKTIYIGNLISSNN
jgi:hypothetical protein